MFSRNHNTFENKSPINPYSRYTAKSTNHYLINQFVEKKIEPFLHPTYLTQNAKLDDDEFEQIDIPICTHLLPAFKTMEIPSEIQDKFANVYIVKDTLNERYKQNVHAANMMNDTQARKAMYMAPLEYSKEQGLLSLSKLSYKKY